MKRYESAEFLLKSNGVQAPFYVIAAVKGGYIILSRPLRWSTGPSVGLDCNLRMIIVAVAYMKSLLMIPTYNERDNLESLVDEFMSLGLDIDLLIIDDSSADGTGEIADRLAEKYSRITVMHRPPKAGRGTASLAGYRYAIERGYDRYLEADSDHSHPPAELPGILSASADADLVIGSRFFDGNTVRGWGLYRRFLHFAADLSIRFILGLNLTDPTNGYHCYSVKMLGRVNFERLKSDGYVAHTILKALLQRAGYKIREVPSVFLKRKSGRSKMSPKEALKGVKDMLVFRWQCIARGHEYFLHGSS